MYSSGFFRYVRRVTEVGEVGAGVIYSLPGKSWHLQFSDTARLTMEGHFSRKRTSVDWYGQLFTRKRASQRASTLVTVNVATVLMSSAGPWEPARFSEPIAMCERNLMDIQGFEFIGFWHSYPHATAKLLPEDVALAQKYGARGANRAPGSIIFATMSMPPAPKVLRLWVDDGNDLVLASQGGCTTNDRASEA